MFTALIRLSRRGFATFAGGALLALQAQACAAAEASAWDGDSRSAVRLVAGAAQGDGAHRVLRAAIEIRLAPGWKTYWRYPGDSGVPPSFDFSGSDNVKSTQVAWPAPHRISDGEGNTIGYKERLALPLRIEPKDPGRTTVLRLKLNYAACEKLCVPVEASAELPLTDSSSANESIVVAAEKSVPRPVALGAKQPFSIMSVQRIAGSPQRLRVDVATPAGSAVELFAEGPSPDWALPLPDPIGGAPPGHQRFEFALDGLPPGAKPDGATLTLTAVSGEEAIETAFRLD